ncbi:MAG: GNAT family N-acetyltransferase [Alphaproteobacteria bacterium]|nr:GNAT family N-acetyltransferase [Alphaproteobacteria bacterium]
MRKGGGETEVGLAGPEDVAEIVRLVRALAAFERADPTEVRLDENALLREGFGAAPRFQVLLARRRGRPVGFLLFYEVFSTWTARPSLHVEDFFLEPEARGRGLGRRMLAELARIGLERDARRIDLNVLEWNPARAFYERLGFAPRRDWIGYRAGPAEIAALAATAGG